MKSGVSPQKLRKYRWQTPIWTSICTQVAPSLLISSGHSPHLGGHKQSFGGARPRNAPHGAGLGRFCSLDQTHLECESALVEIMPFRPRNRLKNKKKRSSPKTEEFLYPKSSEDKKKTSSPQFGTKFVRNLWDLFVLTGPFSSDQPALKSRREDAKPRWGEATLHRGTRPPTI